MGEPKSRHHPSSSADFRHRALYAPLAASPCRDALAAAAIDPERFRFFPG